ncbi:hypothetical protein CEXT_494961 [Caerostris extrusa]|uniref:Uncharacterized protein n=1 Tax=Caerostris extrusa TaxID=172846 RepID=A0AAV4M9P9_CAEEX|nr:hypothetical protein CEXT_494961 [Caerostris extrusa]
MSCANNCTPVCFQTESTEFAESTERDVARQTAYRRLHAGGKLYITKENFEPTTNPRVASSNMLQSENVKKVDFSHVSPETKIIRRFAYMYPKL